MPGNVRAAVPVGSLPEGLCSSFVRTRAWSANVNVYRDGRSEGGSLAGTESNTWQLAKSLTPAAMEQLRQFYLDHHGPHIAFWFTDPEDGLTYAARFASPFEIHFGRGRSGVQLVIVEIA